MPLLVLCGALQLVCEDYCRTDAKKNRLWLVPTRFVTLLSYLPRMHKRAYNQPIIAGGMLGQPLYLS